MGGRETFLPTALVVYACTRAARGYVENPPHPHLSPWSQTGDDLFNEGHYAWAKTTYSEALTAIQYGIFIGDELPRSECQCVPPPLSLRSILARCASHTPCVLCRGEDIIGSQRVLPKTASHLIVNLKLKLASCCLCEGDAPGAIAFCVKAEAMKCSIPASLRSKVRKRNGIVTAVTASTWQCVLPIFLKRARRVF
jgi:hypothetical protein